MKKRDLEIILQGVYDFDDPKPRLEQYITPAPIAADILYNAFDDINGKRLIDLGCGTGMFAIGGALLGADATGVDADESAIRKAEAFCSENGIKARFVCSDVSGFLERCDTVVMNPPFGSQRRHADRPFMDKAIEIGSVIYHLCLSETKDFVERYYEAEGRKAREVKRYVLEIRHRFDFHTKDKRLYEVSLIRVIV